MLAHEISHSLLGHATKRIEIRTTFLCIRAFVLTATPWSYKPIALFIWNYMEEGIKSGLRRFDELDADKWGLEIAAFACFDTGLAANFFRSVASGDETVQTWQSTHPPHLERYKYLIDVVAPYSQRIAYARQRCKALGLSKV